MIVFRPVEACRQGVVEELLLGSYAELLAENSDFSNRVGKDLAAFAREVVEDFDIIGGCLFLSCIGDKPIGFGSFDPRKEPHMGRVGHNCILPEQRRRGFGAGQVMEIVRRFAERGIAEARVTTSDHPFFIAARRNYESCGFIETRRTIDATNPGYSIVEYARLVGGRA